MRLQKYISACGVASRRAAETLIIEGKIKINGQIATLGDKVDPEKDTVEYNGRIITPVTDKVYLMLNKPTGYITSSKDQFGRKTVLDLIQLDTKVYPVGRLDYHTSGLLLLTNDGDLANALMHPKYALEKTYIVRVTGNVSEEAIKHLKKGVRIDTGYTTQPAGVKILKKGNKDTTLEIKIKEGKNRQIRKMIDVIEHKVIALRRVSIGEIALGDLKIGKYRALTPEEIDSLKQSD